MLIFVIGKWCGSSKLKVSWEQVHEDMDQRPDGFSKILGNEWSNDATENAQVWMDRN